MNYFIEKSIKTENIDLARSLLGSLLGEDEFKLKISLQNDVVDYIAKFEANIFTYSNLFKYFQHEIRESKEGNNRRYIFFILGYDLNEIDLLAKSEKAWNRIIIKLDPNIVVLNQYV